MSQSAIEILTKLESNQTLSFHSAASGTHLNVSLTAENGTMSPDELFIGSMCTGFMKRVLSLAVHEKFQIVDFACSITATFNCTPPHPCIDKITLVPALTIHDVAFLQKAMMLLQKGRMYCITLNSLNALIVFAPNIKISQHVKK